MILYGNNTLDYIYNVLIPHVTTTPPTDQLDDDFLLNVQIGSVWIRWMNFGPSFKSRSRTVNDIFRDNLPISIQLGVMALPDWNFNWSAVGYPGSIKTKYPLGLLWHGYRHLRGVCACHCAGANFCVALWRGIEMVPAHGLGRRPTLYLGFSAEQFGLGFL